jgi:hypothetical protein
MRIFGKDMVKKRQSVAWPPFKGFQGISRHFKAFQSISSQKIRPSHSCPSEIRGQHRRAPSSRFSYFKPS